MSTPIALLLNDFDSLLATCARVAGEQAARRGVRLDTYEADNAAGELVAYLWEKQNELPEGSLYDLARWAWGCCWRRIIGMDDRHEALSLEAELGSESDLTLADVIESSEPVPGNEAHITAIVISEAVSQLSETGKAVVQGLAEGQSGAALAAVVGASARSAQRLVATVRQYLRAAIDGISVFIPPALRARFTNPTEGESTMSVLDNLVAMVVADQQAQAEAEQKRLEEKLEEAKRVIGRLFDAEVWAALGGDVANVTRRTTTQHYTTYILDMSPTVGGHTLPISICYSEDSVYLSGSYNSGNNFTVRRLNRVYLPDNAGTQIGNAQILAEFLAAHLANLKADHARARQRQQEQERDRATIAEIVELAKRTVAEQQAYDAACQQWAEAETGRLWYPWVAYNTRYVPRAVSGTPLLVNIVQPEDEISRDELADAIQQAFIADRLLQDNPAEDLEPSHHIAFDWNGATSLVWIGAILDVQRQSFTHSSINEPLPYHRTISAGNWCVNIPPMVAEEPNPPPAAALLVEEWDQRLYDLVEKLSLRVRGEYRYLYPNRIVEMHEVDEAYIPF